MGVDDDGSRLNTDLGGDQAGTDWNVIHGRGKHRKAGNPTTSLDYVPRDPGKSSAPRPAEPNKVNLPSTNKADYDYLNDI
jgi:hypothetical protein